MFLRIGVTIYMPRISNTIKGKPANERATIKGLEIADMKQCKGCGVEFSNTSPRVKPSQFNKKKYVSVIDYRKQYAYQN